MTDSETADRLVRRRARMAPVLAAVFLGQQASYWSGQHVDEGSRLVNHVAISAWLTMSVVLLIAFATGGGWFRSAEVRALTDDEGTRANRAEGFRAGFLAVMAGSIALYFVSLFEPLSGREAIHVLMTIGIAAALIRFGMLERRALRDG